MQTIFSPKQARSARIAAQISQGKVATDLGLNRSYLSLFESGKYVFDDATLRSLCDYFQARGTSQNEEPQAEATVTANSTAGASVTDSTESEGPRLCDGFLIPPGADEDEVDRLLDEYARNRAKITALCAYDIRGNSFLFMDSSEVSAKTAHVLRLMARNFVIIETLQGHDTVQPWTEEARKSRPSTTGDFLSQMFSEI
jgi:transcriptional regulator with XRE-family HTH domain